MDLLPHLLLLDTRFPVVNLTIDDETKAIIIALYAIAARNPYPACQQSAERIHSHYQWSVVDLPWA